MQERERIQTVNVKDADIKNMRLCQAQIFFFENNRYEIVCLNISKRLIAQDTKFWLPKTRTEMGP